MKATNDLPQKLGKPAERALSAAGIHTLQDLTKFTEKEVAILHGDGSTAIVKLKAAMEERGMGFKVK